MKNSILLISLAVCLLMTALAPAGSGNPAADETVDPQVFCFGLTAGELGVRGEELCRTAMEWDESSVPRNLEDFPISPVYFYGHEKEIENLETSLTINGRKATWVSGVETVFGGEYEEFADDEYYGWTRSWGDIYLNKTGEGTYESVFFQDASDLCYVRQERIWHIGSWKYRFGVDFYEADQSNGARITAVDMYNSEIGMGISWQIDSARGGRVMIDVDLYEEEKYYSMEYDLETGKLIHWELDQE